MKVLIVGGGGREHALAIAFAADDSSNRIFVAPGNPGTAAVATNLPIPADSTDAIVSAAQSHDIDLTVVGPELPLARGLADRLRGSGRAVIGPGRDGAQIEASKAFAKEVMRAAGVPTARSATFEHLDAALAYIDHHAEPLVVKASGLAAGKGAIVCATRDEARHVARAMLHDHAYGDAGRMIVVEDFLPGEELSVLAVTNGHEVRLLPAAQDHKRLLGGDKGPNTGGMGAYAPVSIATPEVLQRISDRVLLPTLRELSRRRIDYRGVLYAGLMLAPDGTPNVVEFNCRLGDPETQVVLPLVKRGLGALLMAAARGEALPEIAARHGVAVTTVLAARGYPDAPEKGAVVTIPNDLPAGVTVYHAGTARRDDGALVTAGGRVLAVTAVAETFGAARAASTEAAERISFDGKQFRKDIGWREQGR